MSFHILLEYHNNTFKIGKTILPALSEIIILLFSLLLVTNEINFC